MAKIALIFEDVVESEDTVVGLRVSAVDAKQFMNNDETGECFLFNQHKATPAEACAAHFINSILHAMKSDKDAHVEYVKSPEELKAAVKKVREGEPNGESTTESR